MNVANRDADLRAAAQALASWVHARRAAWTSAPLPRVAPPPAPPRSSESIASPRAPESIAPPRPLEPVVAPRIAEPAIAAHGAQPAATPAAAPAFSSGIKIELTPLAPGSSSSRIEAPRDSDWVASARPRIAVPEPSGAPVGRWLAIAGVAVAAGAAIFIGAPRLWHALPVASIAPTHPADSSAGGSTAPETTGGTSRTGRLRVESTPEGARVLVDGKERGVTPLAVNEISAGHHEVTIESTAGTVHRSVTVGAGQTASVEESIFSGWAVVYAPFEVVISEGGRVLAPDDRNQIMLPPGPHQLRITNRALAYDTVQRIDIKPGEPTTVRLAPPPSMLTVTASELAEVWVDGARWGDTPLQGAPLSLGTHQIVIKRAAGGEKRMTITAGVNPVIVNVDFK